MIRLSLAIMHHPSRAARLPGLVYALDGYPVTVVADTRSEGPWPTAQRVWRSGRKGATHILSIQDDVVPCRDFVAGVIEALTVVPDKPVAFYCKRQDTLRAKAAGKSWLTMPDGTYGPAMCLPVDIVDDFLAWEPKHVQPDFYKPDGQRTYDDTRLCLYLLVHQRPVWVTAPSLVEHDGRESTYKGGHSYRSRAAWYIGADASALDIDWTRGAEDPHVAGAHFPNWRRFFRTDSPYRADGAFASDHR